MPYNADENEKNILDFWDKDKTFEKSVSERPETKPYVFYDGPPFATGLPHYGHIVAGLMKDVVPRYWTMQGYRVERVWGWDCHGLPVENIIESDLGLKSKKEIEELGVDKFNEACRSAVLKYTEEWRKTVSRMGRWVDMENAYKTMDIEYMESVWWVFKELWNKKLIYEGYKAMHICPRCVTPLSNFEVTQGYKDVKDLSATARFKLKDPSKFGIEGDVYILAWTTTPWTLPGNVALAIGEEVVYKIVKFEENNYIVAKERLQEVFKDKEFEVIEKVNNANLIGLEYEPLFPYFSETENAFRVVVGDFVNTDNGTGVVHIAPAFGDDDYNVGQKEKIGWVQHVSMEGLFTEDVIDFAGAEVKPKEDPTVTDIEIIKWLAHNGKLFSKAKYEHSYPHCWRCDTPLLNYATSSWFVRVTDLKDDLLKNNEKISWVPDHMKEGRFGKWLGGARDWAISRNRFWGTPLPIWTHQIGKSEIRNPKSEINSKCQNIIVIGSVRELEKLAGRKVEDIHKHIIDKLILKCEKCGGEMERIPEVLDCWFESGSMPYAQMHYPFENKEKFEAGFPSEFIAEGQDQTRGWFYTLHVLATALTSGNNSSIPKDKTSGAFKNVIVNGIVLAEDGKKMSKRLQNYPDPMVLLQKYGADAMRYYLVSSPVMYAENLNFSEAGVRDVYNRVINTLWNVFTFYEMFANSSTSYKLQATSFHVLDRWILAKLQLLIKDVTEGMNGYKLAEASRPIMDFVLELSQWYVRRSRDRFKGDNEQDKQFALATLREVLLTLSRVMAPFTPFIAETLFQEIRNPACAGRPKSEIRNKVESVHLEVWPKAGEVNQDILDDMQEARKIVEASLSLRKEAKIKVRQVLQKLTIDKDLSEGLKKIIADEVNVKEVVVGGNLELDTKLTDELKKEGLVREIVRAVNQIRKEKGLTRENRVRVVYETKDEELKAVFEEFNEEIKKQVLAEELKAGVGEVEVDINEKKIKLNIKASLQNH
ncbi:MAG: isoleucine--tRNA ligase [bacterium]|nr:isoleucine--tRNA ligase [bacterium]